MCKNKGAIPCLVCPRERLVFGLGSRREGESGPALFARSGWPADRRVLTDRLGLKSVWDFDRRYGKLLLALGLVEYDVETYALPGQERSTGG